MEQMMKTREEAKSVLTLLADVVEERGDRMGQYSFTNTT